MRGEKDPLDKQRRDTPEPAGVFMTRPAGDLDRRRNKAKEAIAKRLAKKRSEKPSPPE